jgi:hypothetical protein
MIKDLRRSCEFDLDSSIFSSVLILAFGTISLISLIGFPKPEYDYFLICGLGLLLVNFSVVFKAFFRFRELPGIDAVITVVLLFFALAISNLTDVVSSIFVFILATVGYVCFCYVLWRSKWSLGKLFVWIVIPGLLSLWVAGFQYGSTFHHPLYLEKITLGVINHDQIYHTSITEIIRTYFVPSTGLQGTPYVPYHFGSHIVMAMFSNLLDVSALASYNILFPVIILPLYFRVALFVVKDLVRAIFRKEEVVSDWLFWMSFIGLTISFIPNDFASEKWAIWDSWIISESYLFSLIFLFFTISLTIAITSESSRKRQILFSVLLAIVLLLMGLSKISVITVCAGAGLFMIARTGRWRTIWGLAMAFIVVAITVLAMKVATRHSLTSLSLDPLHFIKEWVPQSTRFFFIPVFYFSLIVYALVRIKEQGVRTMSELTSAIRLKQFIDVEFLVVSALIGIAPALIFPIENGSGWYFMDIQARLALVFLAAFILYKRSQDVSGLTMAAKPAILSFFARYALISIIVILLVINNVFSRLEDLVNVNLKLRLSMIQLDSKQSKYYGDYTDIYKYIQGDRNQIGEKLTEIVYLPGKVLHNSEKFNYYKWLSDTCSTIENKKDYYFTMQNDSSFFATAHRLDWAAPFIVPSLTGIALTNGVPPTTKDFYQYGYVSYKGPKIDSTQCSASLGKQILLLEPFRKSIVPCK